MTEKTFKQKSKELQDRYAYWAKIRNEAINELYEISKMIHKLEEKYFEEHPEKIENERKQNRRPAKKICLRDCKMNEIILVKGVEYDIEWNPVSKCMFVRTIWGDIPLNDAEYKNIFS